MTVRPVSQTMTRSRFLGAMALLVASLGGLGGVSTAGAQGGPSLVVLVRHGEKAVEPAGDPSLSPAGQERAKALNDVMSSMHPDAIIVTATRRTAETAAVVAAKYGIIPQVISLAGGGAAHIAAVVDAVKKSHGTVLVVGHSNTIPAIVKALGGPQYPDICDTSYANLFVLTPGADGKDAKVEHRTFGAADPQPAPSCAAMTPK